MDISHFQLPILTADSSVQRISLQDLKRLYNYSQDLYYQTNICEGDGDGCVFIRDRQIDDPFVSYLLVIINPATSPDDTCDIVTEIPPLKGIIDIQIENLSGYPIDGRLYVNDRYDLRILGNTRYQNPFITGRTSIRARSGFLDGDPNIFNLEIYI